MNSPSFLASSYDPTKPDSLYTPSLNLKVFYVKLRNCEFQKSAPSHLSLNYIPLSSESIVEVNGRRSGLSATIVSSTLRRDRIDKKSEEAIFVSTDDIRMSGSVMFEICSRENLLLSGILELTLIEKWSIKCEPVMMAGAFYFVKGKKQFKSSEVSWPSIEVYVTGLFSGSAVILTETIYVGRKKNDEMGFNLDSVPEDETTGMVNQVLPKQLMKYEGFVREDDGELSLFNAGVSVGVGIGLTICLCIGIGTGLLFGTYKTTARNFKKLL